MIDHKSCNDYNIKYKEIKICERIMRKNFRESWEEIMVNKNSIKRKELLGCNLCNNPKCTMACKSNLDPGKKIRSVWFGNEEGAAMDLPEINPCEKCNAECEKACVKNGKVAVKDIINRLYEVKNTNHEVDTIDYGVLKTDICGITIENPFLLSSSVVASTYDMCARAFEAGWAGICFKTICNFEIHEASPRFSAINGDDGSIVGFKNIEQLSDHSLEENMAIFRKLKENYPGKFILASIMGRDTEEWGYLAKACEDNGADAIELNFSCPNMQENGLGSDVGQIPELVEEYTRVCKEKCSIPVIAKLTPNVANMSVAAEAAIRGGADGIAAINTIKSVTGVNLYTHVAEPAVHGKSAFGGYSGNAVKPIALRFIAELGKNEKLAGKHITGMGGIETWQNAAEFLLLGATSVQVTTAVMKYGYRIIDDLKQGMALYLNQCGYKSAKELVGEGLNFIETSTDNIERDTIIYPHFLQDKCVGCGRCEISCRDGGHQAIELTTEGKVRLNPKNCVGCHLCILVCPEDAIVPGNKRVVPRIK